VHPFPDLAAYVPEEYYEPITAFDINIAPVSSLEPREELDKYHQKRQYSSPEKKKGKRSETVL
jgi:hypothetical protein